MALLDWTRDSSLDLGNATIEVVKKENDEVKKTLVGAVFLALLAAEFILTPVLKPVILAARDSS